MVNIKKNVLITGAGGFIGAEVCRQLTLSKKYNVVAVASPFSKSSRLDAIKNKLVIKNVNLADKKSVETLFKKYTPEVVLHLATHGVYQYQQDDEQRIVVDNYLMTLNLLEASKKYNIKKFVNTGSVFEYGSQKGKMKEDQVDLSNILNKYSAVKMATTALANSYISDFDVITLRPFTTYGPTEDSTRFVKATIKRSLKKQSLRIVKNVIRDFVYIEDVAAAYLACLQKKYQSGSIVNVASGKKDSLENVSLLIKKLTKSSSEIIFDNTYKRGKESACWADISRSKKILDWKPSYSLLNGLKKMIYFLSHE